MQGPEDFFGGGLERYASGLRDGSFTIEAATEACCRRIAATNGKLQSFVHVAEAAAMETARALDRLLASGTDLGPLMGVPVGVKDLLATDDMPTRLGSRVDLAHTLGEEGSFMRRLRRAGCVVLGKTRTTEFAMGGFNLTHPAAWNPRSPDVHMTPGGSSAGSAVAVASGQCPLAIGGDTGGSVREPAALCGVVGLKASRDRWELDGIFSFSPTFDSLGIFTADVADAAFAYGALQDEHVPAMRVDELRLGRPELEHFVELDADVAAAYDRAVAALERRGAEIVPVPLPDAADVDAISRVVAIELIGRLGREWLQGARELIDPVPMARLEAVMDAAEYVDLMHRRRRLVDAAATSMRENGLSGWLLPTAPHTATPVAELKTVDDVARWNGRAYRITRLANLLEQVAISIPGPVAAGALPVGLQLSTGSGRETQLLAMAAAVEGAVSADTASGRTTTQDFQSRAGR